MGHIIAGVVSIERVGQELTPADVMHLEERLDALLMRIGACVDIAAASNALNELGEFQAELATACFRFDVHLSPRLRCLVHQFDRADDCDLRMEVFRRIKRGQFCDVPSTSS